MSDTQNIQEIDLQQKVEVIVQKYLTSLKIKYNDSTDKDIDLIDKEFQKNQLLDKIIDSFRYVVDAQTQLIKKQFNTKLDSLDQDLIQVKALVLRGGYQTAPNLDSKISSAPELEVSTTDSFLGEDRPQKDLLKLVTDIDEKTRQKLRATQNHINILMDLQLQMKTQVNLLMEKQEAKPHDIAMVNQLIPHVLKEIDVFLELKMDQINKNTQDLITKEKLQYWTVINDLSEKIETFMVDIQCNLKSPVVKKDLGKYFQRFLPKKK